MDEKGEFLKRIKYYGSNDFAGHFFVKEICSHLDYLESNKELLNCDVASIEDAYLFLWCLSFKQMIKEIDNYNLEEGQKRRIVKLSDDIHFKDSSFVGYINKNYREVFDKSNHDKLEWFDFFSATLNLCYGRYSKGITDEVFRFFEKEYALNLLSDFEVCSKYYAKHKEEFKTLFDGLKATRLFDDQIYLRFLANRVEPNNSFLKEQATFICERTIEAVHNMNLTSDSQDIIQIQSFIQEYGRLAVLYKLKCANDYTLLKKDIQRKLDGFIKKHGVHIQTDPVDLKPAIEILKNSNDEYKFIQITHSENNSGEIENAFDYIFSVTNKNNPLSESFNDISRNRSDKYPYFKQDTMQLNFWIRSRIIDLIFGDEQLLGEFANYIYNVSLEIQERYFNSLIDIEKEISGVVDSLAAMMDLAKQNQFESRYAKALVYGTSLSICTTIEKILRNVALKEVKNDMYMDIGKATLADFFREPFKLRDVSRGLKYHLEFYLIKQVDYQGNDMDKPGLNIRNNLMHGQDDVYENTDYGTCLNLFFMLVSLIDDLLLATEPKTDEDL